jgi:hypothetical protein
MLCLYTNPADMMLYIVKTMKDTDVIILHTHLSFSQERLQPRIYNSPVKRPCPDEQYKRDSRSKYADTCHDHERQRKAMLAYTGMLTWR